MSLGKLGVGDGQGGLVCCSSWGRKESDTTEWLNWTVLFFFLDELMLIWVFQNVFLRWTSQKCYAFLLGKLGSLYYNKGNVGVDFLLKKTWVLIWFLWTWKDTYNSFVFHL